MIFVQRTRYKMLWERQSTNKMSRVAFLCAADGLTGSAWPDDRIHKTTTTQRSEYGITTRRNFLE
jgi:hypothetical protein